MTRMSEVATVIKNTAVSSNPYNANKKMPVTSETTTMCVASTWVAANLRRIRNKERSPSHMCSRNSPANRQTDPNKLLCALTLPRVEQWSVMSYLIDLSSTAEPQNMQSQKRNQRSRSARRPYSARAMMSLWAKIARKHASARGPDRRAAVKPLEWISRRDGFPR